MALYYVNTNAQTNGDNEVHKSGCSWMPILQNCDPLGDHATCHTAVAAAKAKGYSRADGCAHCSPECHRR